eukprot:CAMPEP_0204598340 /NCGR_PEP_ID=MMETSP0661-20131031/54264_1 /ASSEMBLY_ACC=CAM_ASM_000606 /TAXON_ID=109239 /ORGANISM="Alexandrium margalefi, Strain AMGDE01CS-322" /LENGTH=403 /DNA_ID=CAMNT_0051609043 /DNA_START=62 /DNA_END=1274 /DNA_ORIENTATION=-
MANVETGSSSTDAPAAKRRRINTKKVGEVMERLLDNQQDAHIKRETEWLMSEVKRDSSLLALCRAAIEAQRAPVAVNARLARGVRQLKDVPDYIMRPILGDFGFDIGEVKSLDREDQRAFFRWLLGDTGDLQLPELKMTFEEFKAWCWGRYKSLGMRYSGKTLDAETVDWNFCLGCYSFCLPDGADPREASPSNGMIQHIVEKATGRVASLPEAIRIKYDDIGTTWAITGNDRCESAAISNTGAGFNQACAPLFGAAVCKVTPKKAKHGCQSKRASVTGKKGKREVDNSKKGNDDGDGNAVDGTRGAALAGPSSPVSASAAAQLERALEEQEKAEKNDTGAEFPDGDGAPEEDLAEPEEENLHATIHPWGGQSSLHPGVEHGHKHACWGWTANQSGAAGVVLA